MTFKTNRRHVLSGLSALAVGLAAPHVARAAVRTIKLGHNSLPHSQLGQGSQVFADAVSAHPDLMNTLKIEVRGNAELGDELPMLKNVLQGTLDMSICPTVVASNICPEAGLLDMPFLFASVDRGRAALDGATGEEYMAVLKTKGINGLAWFENGLRHITSNKPVRMAEDLRGLKIRVPQSEIVVDAFKTLGADAKPLPFSELPEALRTGIFEAQENPIATIEASKLYALQKFLCLSGHIYGSSVVAISSDLMEDLSAAQIAALRACALKGTAKTREVVSAAQRDGIGRLKQAGMTVIDDVDVPGLVAAAKPAKERLAAKFGADRLQRLISAGV